MLSTKIDWQKAVSDEQQCLRSYTSFTIQPNRNFTLMADWEQTTPIITWEMKMGSGQKNWN